MSVEGFVTESGRHFPRTPSGGIDMRPNRFHALAVRPTDIAHEVQGELGLTVRAMSGLMELGNGEPGPLPIYPDPEAAFKRHGASVNRSRPLARDVVCENDEGGG